MIRINLLNGRSGSADRLPPALDADGSRSKFLTKRELLLVISLLAIGVAVIGAQVYGVFEETVDENEPLVGIYENPNGTPPVRVAAAVEPTETNEATEPEPLPEEAAVPVAEVVPPPPVAVPDSAVVAAVPPPSVPPSASSSNPTMPGHVVTALRVTPSGAGVQVIADVEGKPEYRSFWLSEPDRLVLDIDSAELRVSTAELTRSNPHPLIRQLRAAQNSFDPPRVRIVLETSRTAPTEITATTAGISVKVIPAP